mgnify:CR=1 FL=1
MSRPDTSTVSTSQPPLWGASPHRLITLEEAWEAIANETRHLAPESVPTHQAGGRVLAKPLLATEDYPNFNKAMMDGFAVRAQDCLEAGASLNIEGLIAAGASTDVALSAGRAARINTGAPVPRGADAVVRIEDTQIDQTAGIVRINAAVKPGQNVTRQGSHCRRGDIILAPPLLLEAAQIAVIHANGTPEVSVYPDVSVAIAPTGDELISVGTPRSAGRIYESNGPMLMELVRQFGGTPTSLGIIRDDESALREKLKEALKSRVVVAAGGMSMGTLDLVPKVLADLGVRWIFHGVQVRPGKPVAYGRGPDGQHVIGLPGNPVSAFVCSWLFLRMVIRGLQGHVTQPPHRWRATLAREMKPAKDPRPAYVPARVWNNSEWGVTVEPCGWGGSGDPFGAALANALLCRDDPTRPLEVGSSVDVILTSREM